MTTPPSKIHNVEISSRYHNPHEISAMAEFVNEAHAKGLSGLIDSMFYDSKNSYCTFTFREETPDFMTEEMRELHQIARKHISQFEWDGWMDHGAGLEEPPQPNQV